MKKLIIILFCSVILMSCKQSVLLISSLKQTVVPGHPNLKKYHNYIVEFSLQKKANLIVDSVKVFEGGKIYLPHFALQKKGTTAYIKNINKKGIYRIEVPVKERNIILNNAEKTPENKLVIFYSENSEAKKLELTEFKTETVTRR